MRRPPSRRTPVPAGRARAALTRAALAFAGSALLAACGVPPTGVIEVGTPATGVTLTRGVYFLVREDPDLLRAASRPDTSAQAALRALLKGPSSAERTTLTTALPAHLPLPRLGATSATLDLRFPEHTPRLSSRAVRQLACTALLNTFVGVPATMAPRAAAPADRGTALPSVRPATARVTVPGFPPALTNREACPGLSG